MLNGLLAGIHLSAIFLIGLTGYVSLDSNADRQPDYDMSYLAPGADTFTVFSKVLLRKEQNQVGYLNYVLIMTVWSRISMASRDHIEVLYLSISVLASQNQTVTNKRNHIGLNHC